MCLALFLGDEFNSFVYTIFLVRLLLGVGTACDVTASVRSTLPFVTVWL